MLRTKRRRLVVEVAGSPGADGGRPSDGRQDGCVLAEAEHTELVGDEVQASKEEGLGRLEDGWNPHPNRSHRLSPSWQGWRKSGPSDDKKVLNVQRLPHGRRQLSVQKVTNK